MINKSIQSGLGLAGLITLLLTFAAIAFGVGSLASKFFANRLSMVSNNAPDLPAALMLDAVPGGLTWNGQQLVLTNQVSPWGIVSLTPLENGQYRKASIPVVENDLQQQLSLQGIAWNGTSYIAITRGDGFRTGDKKVFIELSPETFQISRIIGKAPDDAQCIAWDGINYWAGTRLHTREQRGQSFLYKFDRDLNIEAEYKGAGKGCQGMTWDGKYLWWADVFSDTVSLFNITNSAAKTPAIVHQYKLTLKQAAGIAHDGVDIWIGDYRNRKLLRFNQELYFDWLGNRFDISNPDQLMLIERFAKYQSGNTQLDDLIKPLIEGEILAEEIPAHIKTLRTRYSLDEVRQILSTVKEKSAQPDIVTVIDRELGNLIDTGKIEYSNMSPVDDHSIKVEYFNGKIVNGDLVADWKVVAGNEILSGLDAERPPQLPDEYDFTTYVRYRVLIKNLQSGNEEEYDYDVFGDEDVQQGMVLMENIVPGKYKISVESQAQYYTATKAEQYNGALELKVLY